MARSLLFNILFYVTTTLFVVLGSPLLFAPRRWAMAALAVHGRFELWLLKVVCGIKLEVRGREKLPQGACLVAAKHQSAWETFGLIPLFRDPAPSLASSPAGADGGLAGDASAGFSPPLSGPDPTRGGADVVAGLSALAGALFGLCSSVLLMVLGVRPPCRWVRRPRVVATGGASGPGLADDLLLRGNGMHCGPSGDHRGTCPTCRRRSDEGTDGRE